MNNIRIIHEGNSGTAGVGDGDEVEVSKGVGVGDWFGIVVGTVVGIAVEEVKPLTALTNVSNADF
jgi:hypothetical protein